MDVGEWIYGKAGTREKCRTGVAYSRHALHVIVICLRIIQRKRNESISRLPGLARNPLRGSSCGIFYAGDLEIRCYRAKCEI